MTEAEAVARQVATDQQCLTAKWLAYDQHLPLVRAEALLSEAAAARPEDIAVQYLIAGRPKDGSVSHVVRVVSAEQLATVRETFERVTSEHVYAIQPKGVQAADLSAALWNKTNGKVLSVINDDGEAGKEFVQNLFGSIAFDGVGTVNKRRVVPVPTRPSAGQSSSIASNALKSGGPQTKDEKKSVNEAYKAMESSGKKKKTTAMDFFSKHAPKAKKAKGEVKSEAKGTAGTAGTASAAKSAEIAPTKSSAKDASAKDASAKGDENGTVAPAKAAGQGAGGEETKSGGKGAEMDESDDDEAEFVVDDTPKPKNASVKSISEAGSSAASTKRASQKKVIDSDDEDDSGDEEDEESKRERERVAAQREKLAQELEAEKAAERERKKQERREAAKIAREEEKRTKVEEAKQRGMELLGVHKVVDGPTSSQASTPAKDGKRPTRMVKRQRKVTQNTEDEDGFMVVKEVIIEEEVEEEIPEEELAAAAAKKESEDKAQAKSQSSQSSTASKAKSQPGKQGTLSMFFRKK